MRLGESYKLKTETLGITIPVDHRPRLAVNIPKDSTMTVVTGPLNGERMIDVMWGGKILMIFAQDLRERGELVDEVGS